ncbi:MAG: SLBB domain-containing protein [Ignavibacteria bacterium]
MINLLTSLCMCLVVIACFSVQVVGQVTGAIKLPKPGIMKPGEYDTTAIDKAELMAKETLGMVETPIDPATYILGPNDILTLFIAPILYKPEIPSNVDIPVSPDGRLVIPGIGAIHVGGISITDAEERVREEVTKILKTNGVSLSLRKMRTFKVFVRGAVRKPGIIPATPADRVSEIIDRAGGLMFDASMRTITITRSVAKEISTSIPVDLHDFYFKGDKSGNPFLNGGDVIFVPAQSSTHVYEVDGEVGKPGMFEFKDGEMLSSALLSAGGYLATAKLDSIEISRFNEDNRTIKTWFVDASDMDPKTMKCKADIPLEAGDRIAVRKKYNWRKPHTVVITGEVMNPGHYAIDPESVDVHQLIERAGGFTKDAYPPSSLLIRQSDDNNVYDIEYWRLVALPPDALSDREKAFMREKKREIRGMIAVDYASGFSNKNIQLHLEHEDSIHISKKKDFINVFGKVKNPGRIKFNPRYSYQDYIKSAGGYSTRADEDETLVLKQRGEQFLADDDEYELQPGDQILVPEVPESTLTFSQILSMALTITAQIITVVGVIYTLSQQSK